jgi:hypothetical protein
MLSCVTLDMILALSGLTWKWDSIRCLSFPVQWSTHGLNFAETTQQSGLGSLSQPHSPMPAPGHSSWSFLAALLGAVSLL